MRPRQREKKVYLGRELRERSISTEGRWGPVHSWETLMRPKMMPTSPRRRAASTHQIFWYRVKRAVASPQTFLSWIMETSFVLDLEKNGPKNVRFLFRRVRWNRLEIISLCRVNGQEKTG